MAGSDDAARSLASLRETRSEYYRILENWKKEKAAIEANLEIAAREKALLKNLLLTKQQSLDELSREAKRLKSELQAQKKTSSSLSPEFISWCGHFIEQINQGIPVEIVERRQDFENLRRGIRDGRLSQDQAFEKLWLHLRRELERVALSEVSRAEIKLENGRTLLTDILRFGGVACFYRTEKGLSGQVGYLRKKTKGYVWIPVVEQKLRENILQAFEIAEKSKVPRFLELPLLPAKVQQ